jgi:hypothetical protein
MTVSPRCFVERAGQRVAQRVQLEIIIPIFLIDALIFPLRNHSRSSAFGTIRARQVTGDGQLARIPRMFDRCESKHRPRGGVLLKPKQPRNFAD